MIAFIIANSFTLMMIFIYIVTVWISINYLRYGRLFVLQGLRSSILARRERQRVASVEKIRARRREEQKLVERYYQERKIKRLEDVADWNRKFNKGTVRTEVTSTPIRGYQS